MTYPRILTGLIIFLFCEGTPADRPKSKSQRDADTEAVERALLDYIEGAYEMDPEKTRRSIHPDLSKIGFHSKNGEYKEHRLTFEQLVKLVNSWNKDGRAGKNAPKDVIVLDVLDQTASAKIVAYWGIDFVHLAKFDGRWMIIHIL